ncbi:hypothetical protein BU198_13240 [Streptomyces sp. CBMA156]|nr:hypothetical protein [Streptomyces sp. CBMA156]
MVLGTLETLRLTIAAIRQRTGESQRELAAALDLTQDKISRRQSGAQPWSLDEVDTLAGHWGMGPLDLLAGPTHAAQSLTWPPGTAAPAPVHALVPPAFAAPAAPTPMGPAPLPAPTAPVARRRAPRRGPAEPYVPHTPVPDSWVRPGERAAAAPTGVDDTGVEVTYDRYADRGPDGEPAIYPPAPCVHCGQPVHLRIGGQPSHPAAGCVLNPAPEAAVQDEQQQPVDAAPATRPAPAPAADEGLPAAEAEQPPGTAAPEQPAPTDEADDVGQLLVDPALVGLPTADYDRDQAGQPVTHPATPCEQCGRPVTHRIGGHPLHLGGWCTPATTTPATTDTPTPVQAAGAEQQPTAAEPPAAVPAANSPAAAPGTTTTTPAPRCSSTTAST